MICAPWVKSCAATRAGICTAETFGDRKSVVTPAAKDRVSLAFLFIPDGRGMIRQLLVTMDAGIKRVAAFEFHCNDIAVSMVMRTLSLFIDAAAAHHHHLAFSFPFFSFR